MMVSKIYIFWGLDDTADSTTQFMFPFVIFCIIHFLLFWVTQKNRSLTHFMPLASFDIPWKYQKTRGHDSFHIWWKKKFPQTSKSLKILWTWLSVKISFPFYVFINCFNFKKQSYFGWDLLYLSICGITWNDLYETICMTLIRFWNLIIQIWRERTHPNFNAESYYDFAICTFRLVESY